MARQFNFSRLAIVLALFSAAGLWTSETANAENPPPTEKSETSEVDAATKKASSQIANATHRQSGDIVPMVDGEAIRLNTFCISEDGHILAACGGKQTVYVETDSGFESKEVDEAACLLQMNTAGKVLHQWKLDFRPTAVNVSPQGIIFVAGAGQIAKIADGKIVATGKAPHVGDIEEFTRQAVKQAEEQAKEYAAMFDGQIKSIKKRIAKIEKVKEEDRTKVQRAQLDAFSQQLEMFEEMGAGPGDIDPEAVVEAAQAITSLAVSEEYVFWVCQDIEGQGYSIWRTDHQFKNGSEVLGGVSGCCGQMDIQCCDGKLLIADNTSYKVSIYDRDGGLVGSFGKRDRSSNAGFGSCCNPMNVRAMPDGTILTAESSIGHIKRFDLDGNFIEYVGRAKVGGGCKHCALGYSKKDDQYFMMHEDESKIVVLSNTASLPEQTEDEIRMAELHAKFDAKVMGTWEVEKPDQPEASEQVDVGGAVYVGGGDDFMFSSIGLLSDGKMTVKGGGLAMPGSDWAWEPVSGNGSTLTVSVISDQVEMLKLAFELTDDNAAKLKMVGSFGSDQSYSAHRIKDCHGKPCGKACEEATVAAATEVKPGEGQPKVESKSSKADRKRMKEARKKELEGKSPEEQKALKKKWREERRAAKKENA